jgi:hypothetical protein
MEGGTTVEKGPQMSMLADRSEWCSFLWQREPDFSLFYLILFSNRARTSQ